MNSCSLASILASRTHTHTHTLPKVHSVYVICKWRSSGKENSLLLSQSGVLFQVSLISKISLLKINSVQNDCFSEDPLSWNQIRVSLTITLLNVASLWEKAFYLMPFFQPLPEVSTMNIPLKIVLQSDVYLTRYPLLLWPFLGCWESVLCCNKAFSL